MNEFFAKIEEVLDKLYAFIAKIFGFAEDLGNIGQDTEADA